MRRKESSGAKAHSTIRYLVVALQLDLNMLWLRALQINILGCKQKVIKISVVSCD
jgi:hypothetical protein